MFGPAAAGSRADLCPGEIEEEPRQHRLQEGIEIPAPTWAEIGKLAAELGVEVPTV